jgi:hypothetical protein
VSVCRHLANLRVKPISRLTIYIITILVYQAIGD